MARIPAFSDGSKLTQDIPLASGQVVTVGADATVAGTGVTLADANAAAIRKLTFTFVNAQVTLADEAGVVAYGGLKFCDMQAGAIIFLGAVSDLDVTKSSAGVNDDWDGDFAIGTVTASNNNTLTGTEASILPSTATPQASGGATTANGQSTLTQSGTVVDGTSTAVDVYINFLVDDADHNVTGTACNLILNGTVTLLYANLGDY